VSVSSPEGEVLCRDGNPVLAVRAGEEDERFGMDGEVPATRPAGP